MVGPNRRSESTVVAADAHRVRVAPGGSRQDELEAALGMLVYDTTTTLIIDDRVLAHLQVVIINKLRRRESFAFTWREGGRDAVCWMAPAIALEFVYWSDDHPPLNRKWLETLAGAAYANSGLTMVPEPADV